MRTGVVVLSSCADFYEQVTRQVIPAVGLASFSRVDTIEAAMQRFSPSDSSDCGVCIVHGDDKKIKWSLVVPIVQRFFAPVFVVDYGSSQLQRDASDSANEVTALASGTHHDARLERVVAELSRRFSLDAKRARAIRFLAEGGARNELPTELEVGEERVKQIITSIHRRLRTTRVDEIAHEVVLATLRGRSAFYDREPTHDPRRK